jgi:hypothetical protein
MNVLSDAGIGYEIIAAFWNDYIQGYGEILWIHDTATRVPAPEVLYINPWSYGLVVLASEL